MNRFLVLAVALFSAMPLATKVIRPAETNRSARYAVRHKAEGHSFDLREVWSILKAVVSDVGKHNDSVLAAAVAFYALFALFPALGAATWIFGLLANPASLQDQLNNLRDVVPQEAWQLIEQQLKTLTAKSVSLSFTGVVSLIIALYSAR